MTLEQSKKIAIENIKDIISVGFEPQKTFIFLDTEYMRYNPNPIPIITIVTYYGCIEMEYWKNI